MSCFVTLIEFPYDKFAQIETTLLNIIIINLHHQTPLMLKPPQPTSKNVTKPNQTTSTNLEIITEPHNNTTNPTLHNLI